MPQRRTLHPRQGRETGTVIKALTPWQFTKAEPAGILRAQQGKEETGKREIPATQGSWRICSGRKSLALTLPQGLPRGTELAAPPCTEPGKAIGRSEP